MTKKAFATPVGIARPGVMFGRARRSLRSLLCHARTSLRGNLMRVPASVMAAGNRSFSDKQERH